MVNPLGRATLLREDRAGLYGEFHVSKTAGGDEALELVRDGALDSFSVGFTPIKQVQRNGVTVRTETGIREASLVTFPAYEDALVGGVRWEDFTQEQLDLLRQFMAQAQAATPEGDSADPDTATVALVQAVEDSTVGHSARQAKFHFLAAMQERGLRDV
jgi:phage head maturation protease